MPDHVNALQSQLHSIQSREPLCEVDTSRTEKECILIQRLKFIIHSLVALHISHNAEENVFDTYHPFMKYFYETVFANSKLSEKPMPWRRTLILEIIYSC